MFCDATKQAWGRTEFLEVTYPTTTEKFKCRLNLKVKGIIALNGIQGLLLLLLQYLLMSGEVLKHSCGWFNGGQGRDVVERCVVVEGGAVRAGQETLIGFFQRRHNSVFAPAIINLSVRSLKKVMNLVASGQRGMCLFHRVAVLRALALTLVSAPYLILLGVNHVATLRTSQWRTIQRIIQSVE